MPVGEDATLAPDQPADEDGVPTGRLQAHNERTGLNPRDEAVPLLGRPWRGTTTAMGGDHALKATPQDGLWPGRETRRAEAPALADHGSSSLLEPQVAQHTETPPHPDIVLAVGVLEAGGQVFGWGVAYVSPDAHGGILLGRASF
jgi:hypothetical protein